MLSHWFSWWRDVFLAMLKCAVATKKLYHPYFDLLTAIGFLTTLAAATCWHPTAKSIYAWYVFQNPWVLHCKAHVLVCLGQVRSLVCGGVYWAAPPCSTWVWLSRSTTGRSLTRPRGPWVSTVGTPFVWDMFSSPLLIALSSSFTLEGSFKELYQNSRITIPEPSSSCWGKQSFLFGFWNLDISNPEGSRIWKKVRRANRLIRRLLYMQLTCIQENRSIWYPLVFRFIGLCVLRCEYLFQKKVYYVIENPVSSLVLVLQTNGGTWCIWLFFDEKWEATKIHPNHDFELKTIILWPLPFWQEMLKRHNAFSVSVPLGAYGGPSELLIEKIWDTLTICMPIGISVLCACGNHASALLRKRVTLYTTCPWIQELGTTLDPTRRCIPSIQSAILQMFLLYCPLIARLSRPGSGSRGSRATSTSKSWRSIGIRSPVKSRLCLGPPVVCRHCFFHLGKTFPKKSTCWWHRGVLLCLLGLRHWF